MPRATNNIEDLVEVQLKTCPGGYVRLRRMTYGQYLKRRSMAMEMQMQTGASKGQGATMGIEMAELAVAEFEFGICIAEHNLEDEAGNALDFRQKFAVHVLDPRIGQEIGDHINKMNSFEDDLGN